MENTFTPIISASAVEAIGTTLSQNISAVAPSVLGVMAIVLVPYIVFRFIRNNV